MAGLYESDGEVDRRLRAALEPGAGRVARVAEGALRAHEARRRRSLAMAAAAVAATVVALVLVAVLLLPADRPAAPPETSAGRYSMYNRDGVLVVRSLDGGATFLRPGERSVEPPRGMMLIVRKETRP